MIFFFLNSGAFSVWKHPSHRFIVSNYCIGISSSIDNRFEMGQTNNNYGILVNKLDQFIRKFYLNRLIKGALYFLAVVLVLFLTVNFLEHNFYFDSSIRKIFFFAFLAISGVALYGWVLKPILQYFRLGRTISHEKAADIIGDHFTEVQDKLLNILQLKRQADVAGGEALILAGIDQKSEEIKVVPFRSAINLAKNRKYLRYVVPPLLILLVILFAAPSIIKDSTYRLLNNNKEFERPAPFAFILESEELSVVQFDDYPLAVKIEGDELPNEVFIEVDNYQYRMNKESADEFTYKFNNVQKDTEFRLFSSGVNSKKFTLNVLEKPNLLGFDIQLDYPGYTQRQDEELSNIGDLVLPAGTKIDWMFTADKTDEIDILFSSDNERSNVERMGDKLFTFNRQVLEDENYRLYVSNEQLPLADSIDYSIRVIPDAYPVITVNKFQDSIENDLVYFIGDASDDYGLLSLSFNYSIERQGSDEAINNSLKLPKKDGKQIQFNHIFNLADLQLLPGDEVKYYFEVFDNDEVNGSKSARTDLLLFSVPTIEDLKAQEEENEEIIKQDLKQALEESKKIQEEMKKMREKILQEKSLDWQNRKELEKLLERQKELEKQVEEAKEKFEENLENQEEFSNNMDEEILEKQEKLQELFEEVISEEMKELMKQIEDLLRELEKDEALEMMENMELKDEELETELDRMLELFKQLELEQEMNEAVDELNELAEEQEELSEQTENQEMDQEQLEEKQEEINEKFDDLQEKMEQIQEKNEELENKRNIDNREEELQDIEQELNDSKEQLQQNQNSKASESQKKASEKMKEMANSMAMEMQSAEMEQLQEDMQALRQLLENLVGLSFDQEDLMSEFNEATINTPKYLDLVQQQFKLQDDFKLVEDSLNALSKRVFQIESFVTEKVSEIKSNMSSSIDDLEDRKKTRASGAQQLTMKNVNDLALMLSEVLNQMQQQMSSMMAGNQMCAKPQQGQGKSGSMPSDKISQGQQELNQKMQQMRQQLQKGGGVSSKEFAKMAARQAALRKALKEKQQKAQESGKGLSKELQELIDKMDQSETDLVNKKLTNEMLKRQQDILTRLLDHEKAEREREFDNKRKSESAQQFERKIPPSLEEYIRKRESEIELYRAVSPSLKPYYKFLVEEYFKTLKERKGSN